MAAYRGISFPFGKSKASFPAAAEDEDLVKQSLLQIIAVANGERVMRPEVGSNALAYVFENNDDVLAELIREELTTAIYQQEPRVVLRDVSVFRTDNEVTITVRYVVSLTGNQGSVAVNVPTAT